MSRHLSKDPDNIIRKANEKFIKRFNELENIVEDKNIKWHDLDRKDMLELWNKAKKNIKPIENKVDLNQSKTKPEDLLPKSNINKTTGLNKNLNFENFVTGRANQLATAAAKQVSEKPGESYNPLFIYGGVGLGKTHLLQSIGNKVKEENKDFKVKYLHAERYVTDVVKAYEGKTFDQFKKNYHSLDLLLIDDIQFIGKKNRTQEEFFYAFNTLIENKKQIIENIKTYACENCKDAKMKREKCILIKSTFSQTKSISQTARRLGISRTTVYKHLN